MILRLKLTSFVFLLIFGYYIFTLIQTHLIILVELRKQASQSYDLMTDALKRQNISRHEISCPTTKQSSFSSPIPLSDKFVLFRDYYEIKAKNASSTNIASYPLNYNKYFQSQLSPHLATFLNALCLCSINSFKGRFESGQYQAGDLDFFGMLRDGKELPGWVLLFRGSC